MLLLKLGSDFVDDNVNSTDGLMVSYVDSAKYFMLLLPFEDYKNCIKSIVWKLGNAFGVRSIEISELTFDKVTVGILNGLRTVVLHPSDAEKNNGLTLQKLSVGTVCQFT